MLNTLAGTASHMGGSTKIMLYTLRATVCTRVPRLTIKGHSIPMIPHAAGDMKGATKASMRMGACECEYLCLCLRMYVCIPCIYTHICDGKNATRISSRGRWCTSLQMDRR